MAETESDLREERAMASKLEKLWHVTLKKLPKNYHLDYAAVKDGVTVANVMRAAIA
jgi:hypothetical protein